MPDKMTTIQIETDKPREVEQFVRTQFPMAILSDPSSNVDRLFNLFKFAVEVMGNAEQAQLWMHEPNRVLGGQKPVDVLAEKDGCVRVETILGRIQHGVYS